MTTTVVPTWVEPGPQVLRVVVDVIQQCNLRCTYCHPGEVWRVQHLDAGVVRNVLAAAEHHGVLEVMFSGGEPTLHPQFDKLLDATNVLTRTAGVLITNATRVDDETAEKIGTANLTRVCVSLDGADPVTHASARGDNYERVIAGLRRIRATGVPVTVISVVHQGNFARIGALTEWLLAEGLADQHHLCAPSYSGEARSHYPDLRLEWDDYFAVQTAVDDRHRRLAEQGLYVTFNSFWPATGRRSQVVDAGRTLTLQQVSEQVKDVLLHVRPSGELRLAAVSWGRETVGNAAVGNVARSAPRDLLREAERRYRDDRIGQLLRPVEAIHKFQLGPADRAVTNLLIDNDTADAGDLAQLVDVRPLTHLSLLENPLSPADMRNLADDIRRATPGQLRFLRHPSGAGIIYDRVRSHATLLHDDEWPQLADHLEPAP